MFKRKLLYLGGFDPRGARFYHQICAEQVEALGADAATISAPRRVKGDVHWRVEGADGNFVTETEFLVWDDIVRQHWIKGGWSLIVQGARAYIWFFTQIDWAMARPVPGGSKFTLFYPGLSMLLAPLLVMAILGGLLALLLPAWVAFPIGLAAGVAATPFILRRIHSLWLMRFIIFNDLLARDAVGEALKQRLVRFTDRIDAVLDEEEWDEILLLTHSNGGMLAVPIVAELLERRGGILPERFSLVTLGATLQLVACRRDAGHFRVLLDRLASGKFHWLDIGSLTDGACIPLVDPCIGRPVTRPEGLKQLSPRWFRYCDPATYRARRRDKYETHFNYLRRLDRPSPLDYVGLTCGARPLRHSIAAFEAENIPQHG